MRWDGQTMGAEDVDALPGLESNAGFVRSVTTPEFAGVTFHEVLAKSALNRVGAGDGGTWGWTINPYRGCSHACVYCFARPTHLYLEFDEGADFDRQIVVKTNVADVLRRELHKPSWGRHPVALGTNTDPYQRAEGRYRLMPGIIEALADSGTPFSILTKGSLLRRDLPLLQAAAERVPVDVAMSIAVYDERLQQSVEPGTPSTAARLATVRAVRAAGLDCAVFLMPVLPYLTDTTTHLRSAIGQAVEAGATSVATSELYLKPGVKTWFMQWLDREHPELVSRYRSMYLDNVYAPKDYRRWLADRVRPIMREFGVGTTKVDPATGSMGFSARGERFPMGLAANRPAAASSAAAVSAARAHAQAHAQAHAHAQAQAQAQAQAPSQSAGASVRGSVRPSATPGQADRLF